MLRSETHPCAHWPPQTGVHFRLFQSRRFGKYFQLERCGGCACVCCCLFGARTRPARFSKLVPLNKSRASFCSRECCLCVPEHVQVFRSRRSLGKRFSGAVVLCDIGPFQQSKVSALFSRVKHIRRWRTVSVRRKTNVSSVDCNS